MNKYSQSKKIVLDLLLSGTARSTYLVFSGNIVSAVLAFLYTVVLVRNLSLADIGYFSALWSFLLLTADVAELGIGTSLSAFIPPLKNTIDRLHVIKTAMILQSVVALIFVSVIFLFSKQISSLLFHTEQFDVLVKITGIGVGFAILNYFYQLALSAEQKFLKVGLLSVIGSAIRLGTGLLLVILSFFTLENSIILQVISLGILLLIGIAFQRHAIVKGKFLKNFVKKFITFSSFLGIARGMTALASRLDVLMIVAIAGPTQAGIYAIASRVISLYPLLAGSFSTVVAPKIAQFQQRNPLLDFTKKVMLGTGGILSTIIFLIIIADPFMTILFQEKGTEAVGIFRVLLTSMLFFVASIPPVTLAIYNLKKPHILTINSIIQVIIVCVGNLVFIPLFGYLGAGYSLIIAYSVTLMLTTILTVYYFNKKYNGK